MLMLFDREQCRAVFENWQAMPLSDPHDAWEAWEVAWKAATEQTRRQRWIPVNERLPEVPEGRGKRVKVLAGYPCTVRGETQCSQVTVFYGHYEFEDMEGTWPEADEDGRVQGFGWHEERADSQYDQCVDILDAPACWMPLPATPQPEGKLEAQGQMTDSKADRDPFAAEREMYELRIRQLETVADAVEEMLGWIGHEHRGIVLSDRRDPVTMFGIAGQMARVRLEQMVHIHDALKAAGRLATKKRP